MAPKDFALRHSDQRLASILMGPYFNPFKNERSFQLLELKISRRMIVIAWDGLTINNRATTKLPKLKNLIQYCKAPVRPPLSLCTEHFLHDTIFYGNMESISFAYYIIIQ